jgi:hypothetical protein
MEIRRSPGPSDRTEPAAAIRTRRRGGGLTCQGVQWPGGPDGEAGPASSARRRPRPDEVLQCRRCGGHGPGTMMRFTGIAAAGRPAAKRPAPL